MRYVYKVDSFGCTFSSRNKFTAQLQAMLDYYASEGWRLHKMDLTGGELCVLVFEKRIEDEAAE